jgi:hypothetical protein
VAAIVRGESESVCDAVCAKLVLVAIFSRGFQSRMIWFPCDTKKNLQQTAQLEHATNNTTGTCTHKTNTRTHEPVIKQDEFKHNMNSNTTCSNAKCNAKCNAMSGIGHLVSDACFDGFKVLSCLLVLLVGLTCWTTCASCASCRRRDRGRRAGAP